MGLAKHFYTARAHGERVPNHVYRFFGEKSPTNNKVPPEERRYVKKADRKPVIQTSEKMVGDILKDLLS